MGPQFYAVRFDTTGKDQDIWMALLSEWPFESFHQENDVLTAYIEDEAWTKELEDYVDGQTGMWFNSFKLSIVPYQNWNEIWESSFNPVAVDQYCYIRAQFHDPAPKGYKHEMVIAPKMAFGTGHHATTYMMLQAMSKIEFTGKSVLDYGCGTGILSVVAAMEGAREVTGIDIQPEALDNSLEHAVINHVESVCHFYMEDLKKVMRFQFDIILANINTEIILGTLMDLKNILKDQGYLLLSGILKEEIQKIHRDLALLNFTVVTVNEREDWVQMTLSK